MSSFRLPDVGEGLTEAEIVAWHVGPGDHVTADQPLVSIETDKAIVEIPSPWSGHIAQVHGAPGEVVQVGELLVEFIDGAPSDEGAIVGDLPRAPATERAGRADRMIPKGIRATPAVRARARELGVDLVDVAPTGTDGTITVADVVASVSPGTAGEVEPLRGVRRAMAANMARSHAEVVPATVTDDADVGDWSDDEGVMIRLVRAVAVACSAEPALNMSFHGPAVGRSPNSRVALGIAMDTPAGLFVPVLDDVGNRPADDLRRALDALRGDVVARSVPPDQLRGQTITLSNFGIFGGRHAALVVVPPQVAIVGAGRRHSAVVARGGQPTVRDVLPVSLTFDHRVVMGGEAARFLATLVADLEAST